MIKLAYIFSVVLFLLSNFNNSNSKENILSYSDKDIKFSIKVLKVQKRKNQYFYYGKFESEVINKNLDEDSFPYFILRTGDEISEIYLDTIASTGNFWNNKSWKDYKRNEKVYFVFSNKNLSMEDIKVEKKSQRYYYWPH